MIKKLLIFFVLLFLPFSALADSVEIANVSAHYAHPLTGVVEDSGNDSAIGQGMTESVLDPQALVETDSSGNIYATIRVHMADQLGGYSVAVQSQGESGFYKVSTQEMRREAEFFDLRFLIPDKSPIIRLDFEVKAMGRHVIFYGMFLDRVEGNTDFIVSVNPNQASSTSEANTSVETVTTENHANTLVDSNQNQNKLISQTTKESQKAQEGQTNGQKVDLKKGEKIETKESSKEEASDLKGPSLGGEVGLLMKGDPRLEGDFLANHEEIDEDAPYGTLTLIALYSIFIIFGVIAILACLSAILAALYVRRLQFRNDLREAKAYGLED